MAYKERVPVCGAILINQHWDKVRAAPRVSLEVLRLMNRHS